MVADYLGANRPYTPKLDGRITEIGAAMAQAEKPAEAAPAADAKLPELPAASSDIAANPPKADAPAAGAAVETAAAPAAKPADAAAANSHVIVAGDSFWNLAKTFYNDPTKWQVIADANPGNRPRTCRSARR